jgi:hypothetical protein
VQFGLEVEQDGGGNGEHHRKLRVAIPHHGAQSIAHDNRRDRGRAGIGGDLGAAEMAGHHHAAQHQQADAQYPGRTGMLGEQGGERARQRNQRKGAQPRLGSRAFFPLKADQQPDGQAGQEDGEGPQVGALLQIVVHAGSQCSICSSKFCMSRNSFTCNRYTARMLSGSGSAQLNRMAA